MKIVLPKGEKMKATFEKEALLQIRIIDVQIDIPQVLHTNHVLVALFRILIWQVVSEIHGIDSLFVVFPALIVPHIPILHNKKAARWTAYLFRSFP